MIGRSKSKLVEFNCEFHTKNSSDTVCREFKKKLKIYLNDREEQ